MSSTELDERVNLKEIVDISEDEFKKQISAWIDEHGLSRKLQSKLRADLFQQFNRTKLGRQMTEQHQLAHRIVLSPLILVLNTLVAEFLYIEDCHFTVSVFANEVPYKNTLPNFETTPSRQLFRFSHNELNDIFEAIGLSKSNEQLIREFYMNVDGVSSGQEVLHKSLLYCILKTLIPQNSRKNCGTNGEINEKPKAKAKTKTKKVKPSTSAKAVIGSTSSQQSANPSPQSSNRKSSSTEHSKCNSLRISSRYFKFLNRYLEILSNRINDMSRSLSEKHAGRKHRTMDSSSQEESLRKDLRKIIENINKLTKSQHKSKRFQDVLNGIERLSASVEKCSEKLEDLLTAVDVQSKKSELVEQKSNVKIDPYVNVDYADWLRGLKTSEHGRKFIDRLEISLQKTLEKERENLEKLYEEKTNNYRMLIRLHYKQKYDVIKSEAVEPAETSTKQETSPLDKMTPDNTEKLLAESLAARALEKEQQVNDIVQTAKHRFQQLERESEQLDQSFQSYLRRQQILKQQMSDDASKIWENYTLSKAALAQFDRIGDKHNITTATQPKLTDSMKVDYVLNSTFYDDVDIQDVLKDLNEIKLLKSPRFNKNEAFPKSNSLFTFNAHKNGLKAQNNAVKSFNGRKEIHFEKQAKVENQIKANEKSIEIPSIILEKPTEPILKKPNEPIIEKPTTSVAVEVTKDLKPQQQNKESKSNSTSDLQNKVIKTNGTAIASNHESVTKSKQPTEIEKSLKTEKTTQNKEIIGKQSNIEIKTGALTNGHSNTKQQVTKETENENKSSLGPLKPNETIKTITITEEEPKLDQIEKVPIIAKENGSLTMTSAPSMTNGFTKKLTTFMPIVSDSDSAEISEQISIGQQRLIKSPDDFWI